MFRRQKERDLAPPYSTIAHGLTPDDLRFLDNHLPSRSQIGERALAILGISPLVVAAGIAGYQSLVEHRWDPHAHSPRPTAPAPPFPGHEYNLQEPVVIKLPAGLLPPAPGLSVHG